MPDFHGYGVYIWSAYGIAFVILAGLIITSIARNTALKRQERHSYDA